MRQRLHMDPAMITASACRLTGPQHGMAMHTLPVTRANVVLTTVLIARNEPTHAVVGVQRRFGARYQCEDNGVLVRIEPDVVHRVVFDSMGHSAIRFGFGCAITVNHLEGEIIVAETLLPHHAIVHKHTLVIEPTGGKAC